MKSPLHEILPLLRVYSYSGIFPAHISKDGSVFTPELWRYFPVLIVVLAYFISVGSMFQWSTSAECLAANFTWENYWTKLSNMDIVISFASVALLAMFFIVAMACHHRCPRRYTCLIKDFLALAEGQASTWASLFHHGIVLACSGICGLVMAAGGILSAEASFNCVDSIVYILTVMISQMYLYLVTNVPELIFVTFFIALENSLMASQEKFKKNGDIKKLCRQLVHLYDTLRHLEDIFGPSIMTSFGFLTLILTCVIYFSFLSLSSTLGFNKAALNTWLCAHIIYAFLTIKRLLHITNHAHRFYRQVDNAVVELIKVDVDHPDKALASQAKDLLQRVDGMPILGFFTLKRGILLAILSNLLTYLIILIEFKMDSL